MWELFSQAVAEVGGVKHWVGVLVERYGPVGLICWFLWYTVTKTQPAMLASIDSLKEGFREEIAAEREHSREVIQRLENTFIGAIENLESSTRDLQKSQRSDTDRLIASHDQASAKLSELAESIDHVRGQGWKGD